MKLSRRQRKRQRVQSRLRLAENARTLRRLMRLEPDQIALDNRIQAFSRELMVRTYYQLTSGLTGTKPTFILHDEFP